MAAVLLASGAVGGLVGKCVGIMTACSCAPLLLPVASPATPLIVSSKVILSTGLGFIFGYLVRAKTKENGQLFGSVLGDEQEVGSSRETYNQSPANKVLSHQQIMHKLGVSDQSDWYSILPVVLVMFLSLAMLHRLITKAVAKEVSLRDYFKKK